MKNVLLTLVALAVLESVVSAGTKEDASVIIRNASTVTAAVIVDPPSTLPASPTLQQFQAAGGRILNPGASTTFRVRAGSHTVIAQLVDSSTGAQIGSRLTQSISVSKNQVLRYRVEGTANASLVAE